MGKSLLVVRLDERVKKRFFEKCEKAGLKPSEAVRLFVRNTVEWDNKTLRRYLLGVGEWKKKNT